MIISVYRGRRIGLAIDPVGSYGRGVIRGIMNYCRAEPSWTIAVEPLWSFGKLPPVDQWHVDGVIVQTFSHEFEDEVLRSGVPASNVSNLTRENVRLPTVIPDDESVGRMAAEYLLSLGFRDLGFCWDRNTAYGELRLKAFRNRAAAAGAAVHEFDGAQNLGDWIVALPKPAGVLGCNDDYAHRVLNEARRRGAKVPDEVAVLGVDDDELFNTLVTPSLSSIVLPAQQIGYQAAAKLDRLMRGEPVDELVTRLPPVRVVARESTDVLSIPDGDVVLALRFIREQAARPIQVDDVLDHVPLSRRSLERKFRRLVGHSISEEIRRAHLERAKQLLVQTDLAMPQIAAASGFTTATRLGIVFQRELKQTPSDFRRRVRAAGKNNRA
jgi:LacI family transcriptional regulator